MTTERSEGLAQSIATNLKRLRQQRPIVHAITNYVTIGDVANALLAIGGSPIMAHDLSEVAEIVARSNALVLNLGTPSPERITAMLAAADAASSRGIPIVLDPVGVGGSRLRSEAALTLLKQQRIAVVRGNLAEMSALGGFDAELSGVEVSRATATPPVAARAVAIRFGTVAAITGPRDTVANAEHGTSVDNGHPLMAKVTGTGCIASAIVAAFCAVEADAVIAATSALVCLGIAGEVAGRRAAGPGTFRAALIDALANITPLSITNGCRALRLETLTYA